MENKIIDLNSLSRYNDNIKNYIDKKVYILVDNVDGLPNISDIDTNENRETLSKFIQDYLASKNPILMIRTKKSIHNTGSNNLGGLYHVTIQQDTSESSDYMYFYASYEVNQNLGLYNTHGYNYQYSNKYTIQIMYTYSTKSLSISRYDNFSFCRLGENAKFLGLENYAEYTPTGDYNPATKKYVDDAVGSIGEPVIYVEEDNSEYKSFVLEEHNPGVYVFKKEPYIKARTSDMMAGTSIPTINNTIYLSKTPTSDDPEGTIVASYISNDLIPCRLKLSSTYIHGLAIEMSEKRSRFVSIGGRDTITGEKTFTYLPKLAAEKTPTADLELVTKKYVDGSIAASIAGVTQFSLVPVDTLPTESIRTDVIYAIPSDNPQEQNVRIEYVYVNDSWEILGNTNIDLSDYYTKSEIDAMITTNNDIDALFPSEEVA